MQSGCDHVSTSQLQHLQHALSQSRLIATVLERAPELDMQNWYLGAGCIAQTIWNLQHGFDAASNIKDCDLVYYADQDLSSEAESAFIERGKQLFSDLNVPVEIVNQARVHVWYKKHFGYGIQPYHSIEQAINTWPTTATCVGVKYDQRGRFIVYAPYGLSDLFGLIVRANKTQITEEIYTRKVERWKGIWPRLTIVPWQETQGI